MFRFAPSPTGDIHIGNLRVAVLNYIISKQKNSKLILRIEDSDITRNIKGADKKIIDILNRCKIEIDELIYQKDNAPKHIKTANNLLKVGDAFLCFCSKEELSEKKQQSKANKLPYRYDGKCKNITKKEIETKLSNNIPYAIRIKKPKNSIMFYDLIKQKVLFNPDEVDDFIIMRSDNTPTYNFACAVDDMSSNIDFIIRGEDHLSNTPKQKHIQNLLNYDKNITYAHLPIILTNENKKMSKRDTSLSVDGLIKSGFLLDAIVNYLILLGSNRKREIFKLNDAIDLFDIEKISKSPAKFSLTKLKFINRHHIKEMDNLDLSIKIGYKDRYLGKLAKLYLEEADTIVELKSKIDNFFSKKEIKREMSKEYLIIKKEIFKAPFCSNFATFKEYLSKNTNLRGKNLFIPLRFILTKNYSGPNLSDIYECIKNDLDKIVTKD